MSDIVERLRAAVDQSQSFGLLMQEAALEIEFLRKAAGAVSRGPSFSEMTSELRHVTPSDEKRHPMVERCGLPFMSYD